MTEVEAPDEETAAALLAVEAQRQQALIDVDLETLDRIFDESLVHIHAPGLTHNKAQLLEHTATNRAYLAITRGELNLRVAGDVAVITGEITNRLRTKEGGERTLSGVATQVLVRGADGVWRFISFQLTPYGERAWPALESEKADAAKEDTQ